MSFPLIIDVAKFWTRAMANCSNIKYSLALSDRTTQRAVDFRVWGMLSTFELPKPHKLNFGSIMPHVVLRVLWPVEGIEWGGNWTFFFCFEQFHQQTVIWIPILHSSKGSRLWPISCRSKSNYAWKFLGSSLMWGTAQYSCGLQPNLKRFFVFIKFFIFVDIIVYLTLPLSFLSPFIFTLFSAFSFCFLPFSLDFFLDHASCLILFTKQCRARLWEE